VSTTSSQLAGEALDGLARSGVRFAVLHGEPALAAGHGVSDVDTVTSFSPERVICLARAAWAEAGLHPVMLWPYDVGAKTVFLATSDASDGVQLDLLHDPDGHGRLRLRSDSMLRAAQPGVRWPILPQRMEATYLLRKRRVKGQAEEAERLAEQLRLLGGPAPIEAPGRSAYGRKMWRAIGRVVQPIGFWLDAPTIAGKAVADRFARFLIEATHIDGPGTARDVAATLFQAKLMVTSGRRRGPHLRTTDTCVEAVARSAVTAMADRLTRRTSG
jgi:hypothetical protein